MADYSTLAPLVRRHVSGCPDFVITDALRYAAREFCRDSWFARRKLEIAMTAGDSEYTLTPADSGEEVIGVARVEYQGCPLAPIDAAMNLPTGSPRAFEYEPPATLLVAPYPAADATGLDDPLYVMIVIQPTIASTSVGDDIARQYDHALADGAVSRICGVEGAAWSSPALAAKHGALFYTAKMQAKGKALRAHAPGGLTVQPRRFA